MKFEIVSSPTPATGPTPRSASDRYPPSGVSPPVTSVIDVTCGGIAGDRVPLHTTPSSFLIDLAGAAMFVKSRPLPLSRFVTVRLTSAGTLPKLATLAMQPAFPVFAANVSGAQSCVSVTMPCFLTNATGIVTELASCFFGIEGDPPEVLAVRELRSADRDPDVGRPVLLQVDLAVTLRAAVARCLVRDDDLGAGRRLDRDVELLILAGDVGRRPLGRDQARHRRGVRRWRC